MKKINVTMSIITISDISNMTLHIRFDSDSGHPWFMAELSSSCDVYWSPRPKEFMTDMRLTIIIIAAWDYSPKLEARITRIGTVQNSEKFYRLFMIVDIRIYLQPPQSNEYLFGHLKYSLNSAENMWLTNKYY